MHFLSLKFILKRSTENRSIFADSFRRLLAVRRRFFYTEFDMSERIYFDNNATTRTDGRVAEAMAPFLTEKYGNPNSLHEFGTEARRPLSEALDRLYAGIDAADEDTIIINGCATEGNNTVLKSAWISQILNGSKKQIIISKVEHHSVSHTAEFLTAQGVEIIELPVNRCGVADADALKELIDPDKTALVSVVWANSETGLINPIRRLCETAHENGVLFHTDAVQAVGKLPVSVREVPVDYLTFTAHKFHGPKGVGGLYLKNGAPFVPLLHGGDQMGGLRSGTVNTAGAVGMGLALELAVAALPYENTVVRGLRDTFEDEVLKIDGTFVVGDRSLRTPNTSFISFKGIEGEAMLWDLNREGLAASTGSACASESLEANPLFEAMNLNKNLSHTGIRFSLSRMSTEEEVVRAVEIVGRAVKRLRSISTDTNA